MVWLGSIGVERRGEERSDGWELELELGVEFMVEPNYLCKMKKIPKLYLYLLLKYSSG